MAFWSKVLVDVLEERNEHDIDRAWAKGFGLKKDEEKTFYQMMRDSREIKRMKRDSLGSNDRTT